MEMVFFNLIIVILVFLKKIQSHQVLIVYFGFNFFLNKAILNYGTSFNYQKNKKKALNYNKF